MATPILEPNVVNIYAVQTTRTMEDHVTDQGFGYSSPLKTPQVSISYSWIGKLHGSRPDVVSSSNSNESLDTLAQNLATNLKSHPSPSHNQSMVDGYRISYEAETKEENWQSSKSLTRPLTSSEQMMFSRAFQDALKR